MSSLSERLAAARRAAKERDEPPRVVDADRPRPQSDRAGTEPTVSGPPTLDKHPDDQHPEHPHPDDRTQVPAVTEGRSEAGQAAPPAPSHPPTPHPIGAPAYAQAPYPPRQPGGPVPPGLPARVDSTVGPIIDRVGGTRRAGPERVGAHQGSGGRGSETPGRRRAGQSDRLDELKSSVHVELLKQLGPHLYDPNIDQGELEQRVRVVLSDVLSAHDRPLSNSDRARVTQQISDDILGYGPLEPYLRDPEVSEVMVNTYDSIWLEKHGRLVKAHTSFTDEAHLRRIIDKIVSRIGRRVDEASPMVDARLPDGSRVNAVVPPLALDGSALTIRKFAADPLGIDDLVNFGTVTPQTADFLDACVRGRLNVIVSGGTGAGKTTTLNVLSSFIPEDERIVTIEDAAELQLKQQHVVRLESRPANIEGKGAVTIRDLVINSLRMRPDRIVVGEVRDASALDVLQAMNTGHDGSICTLHSNGPRDTLSRMETMALMAGMELPIRAIRDQMASAIDLIVHQHRFKDGTRRITSITEVERMDGDVITLKELFVFDNSLGFDPDGRTLGRLRATGLRPGFLEKMENSNVTVDPMLFYSDRM